MAETKGPQRGCETCGQVDDHPRVTHPLPVNDPRATIEEGVLDSLLGNGISGAMLRELQDPSAVVRHIDCCAQAGCPTGSCDEQAKQFSGKTGDALRSAIVKAGA